MADTGSLNFLHKKNGMHSYVNTLVPIHTHVLSSKVQISTTADLTKQHG